jgi:histidine triad (HIT) family protein
VSEKPCVFCEIIHGRAPGNVVHRWGDAISIVPLNPVTPGHLLVLPVQHVQDFIHSPKALAVAARRAADIAPHPSNLIVSAGAEATQTIWHLHVHVIPRRKGDGLALPWTVRADA